MKKQNHRWSVSEAKSRLAEIITYATENGPQTITDSGRDVAVLISAHEWGPSKLRPTCEGTLVDFFAASPLRNSGLTIERSSEYACDTKL